MADADLEKRMTLDQLVAHLEAAKEIVGGDADAFLFMDDYTQQPTEVFVNVSGGYMTVSLVGYGAEQQFREANEDIGHTLQVKA